MHIWLSRLKVPLAMSFPTPSDTERASDAPVDKPLVHGSVDLEAIVAEQKRLQNKPEIDMSESADRVLERLRRRIGQLYGTSDYDHTLSRLGLALLTLEACISRLNHNERAIGESPSLIAIVQEIEKSCTAIEHNAGHKKREESDAPWLALSALIQGKSEKDTAQLALIDRHLSDLRKTIDQGALIDKEQFEKLLDQLTSLRELQLSENRKLFASLGAIHATIERCVDRLSRVEYSLMEARSIETSAAIAEWPQGMQPINLSLTEPGAEFPQDIDPRRALAAARAAAARASSRTDSGRI